MKMTKPVAIIATFIGFGLAFALLTRALTTGSYWQYTGVLLLLVLSVRLVIRTFVGVKK